MLSRFFRSSRAARYAIRVPSGEIWAPPFSGCRKNSSTEMRSGRVSWVVMLFLSCRGVRHRRTGVLPGRKTKPVLLLGDNGPSEAPVGGVENGPVDQGQRLGPGDLLPAHHDGGADVLVD